MSWCCIFNKEDPYIDTTEPIIYTNIILYGYEEIQPGVNNSCIICKEKVCDILAYCYSCKSSIGHKTCLKTDIKCPCCNTLKISTSLVQT